MKKEFDNIYAFGIGHVVCQSGYNTFTKKDNDTDTFEKPFIQLSISPTKCKVGEDLKDIDIESYNTTMLHFENIEGLEVLEKAITYCKQHLLNQKNKK